MTTQDLKNNRERIIKKIRTQASSSDAVFGVMTKMAKWLESREDIQSMKPSMLNLDKFTTMCINSWLKNDYKPVVDQEFLDKREAAKWASISF